MDMRSAALNVLWGASSTPSWEQYRRALRAPAVAQERMFFRACGGIARRSSGASTVSTASDLLRNIKLECLPSRTTTSHHSFIARQAENRTC